MHPGKSDHLSLVEQLDGENFNNAVGATGQPFLVKHRMEGIFFSR